MTPYYILLLLALCYARPKIGKDTPTELDSSSNQGAQILENPGYPRSPFKSWPFRRLWTSHVRRPSEATAVTSGAITPPELLQEQPTSRVRSEHRLQPWMSGLKVHRPVVQAPTQVASPQQPIVEPLAPQFPVVNHPMTLIPIHLIPVHLTGGKFQHHHSYSPMSRVPHPSHSTPHFGPYLFFSGSNTASNFGTSPYPNHQRPSTSSGRASEPQLILLTGNNVISFNSDKGDLIQTGKIAQVYKVEGNSGISFNVYSDSVTTNMNNSTLTPSNCSTTPSVNTSTTSVTSDGNSTNTPPIANNSTVIPPSWPENNSTISPLPVPTSTEALTLPAPPTEETAEFSVIENKESDYIIIFEEEHREIEREHIVRLSLENTTSIILNATAVENTLQNVNSTTGSNNTTSS